MTGTTVQEKPNPEDEGLLSLAIASGVPYRIEPNELGFKIVTDPFCTHTLPNGQTLFMTKPRKRS